MRSNLTLLLALAASFVLLIWPRLFAQRAQHIHSERLKELENGAPERFFEERRSLNAYPPIRSTSLLRLGGGLVFLAVIASYLLRD